MKKITKLEELKKMDKVQLLDEMMKGTIKGGSSCGNTPPPPPKGSGPMPGVNGEWSGAGEFDWW